MPCCWRRSGACSAVARRRDRRPHRKEWCHALPHALPHHPRLRRRRAPGARPGQARGHRDRCLARAGPADVLPVRGGRPDGLLQGRGHQGEPALVRVGPGPAVDVGRGQYPPRNGHGDHGRADRRGGPGDLQHRAPERHRGHAADHPRQEGAGDRSLAEGLREAQDRDAEGLLRDHGDPGDGQGQRASTSRRSSS